MKEGGRCEKGRVAGREEKGLKEISQLRAVPPRPRRCLTRGRTWPTGEEYGRAPHCISAPGTRTEAARGTWVADISKRGILQGSRVFGFPPPSLRFFCLYLYVYIFFYLFASSSNLISNSYISKCFVLVSTILSIYLHMCLSTFVFLLSVYLSIWMCVS